MSRQIRALGSILVLSARLVVEAQTVPEYESPPLRYSETEADNEVTRLQAKLESGSWQPPMKTESDLLRATLAALQVPVESQVLVFSRTSLQRRLIHPRNPRALYFSDDCYVGWVPGGLTEIALTDARLGLAFHRLTSNLREKSMRIQRDPECLSCHAGPLTGDWPGLMIRSVFPDDEGEPITAAGSFLTTHESPIPERWGGWYVTGEHGTFRHMGNSFVDGTDGAIALDRDRGANLRDLSALVPTERYLRSDSDLVALLVLEHQVEMHNRLVRAGLRTRRWMHYQASLRRELGEPVATEPTGSARVVIESETRRILEYLLFCDEAVLPQTGVQGSPAFQTEFRKNRRTDAQGRSLKDLNLRTRLVEFRCSYMIYSQAFDHLPAVLKSAVYRELRGVLSAKEPLAKFAHLGAAERQAIEEILRHTKPDLAGAWSELPIRPDAGIR